MLNTQMLFPQALPWLILFFTIISTFFKPKYWPYGLVITLTAGLFFGAINSVGIVVVGILLLLSFFARSSVNKLFKTISSALVILFCIALAAHLVPGFNNLLVLNDVVKSTDSIGFTMYLNLDKPMILFALLCLQPTLLQNIPKVVYFQKLNVWQVNTTIGAFFIIVFGLATMLSLIELQPSLPGWWWIFALNNLLLTCMVEEVFFRGFIQQQLTNKYNYIVGLTIASLLFGLAHFAGGASYVVVATLAGFLYGFIYQRTGKLSYAILGHFALNMSHLWLFTYPMLKLSE